jgi:hypothetical protein
MGQTKFEKRTARTEARRASNVLISLVRAKYACMMIICVFGEIEMTLKSV